ncbi:MAG: hypothetical protein WCZ23_16395 [Rhodospirillaceae bacterium]
MAYSSPLTRWLRDCLVGISLGVALMASPGASAAGGDHPILLEVVHLQDRVAYQASCDVTDGLGKTRTSTFDGQTNSSVRFVGTGVACRLRSPDAGTFQVTLRTNEAVLARVRGTASQSVTITGR